MMEAGKELDLLVAEKVMGLKKRPYAQAPNKFYFKEGGWCPTCGYDGLWDREIPPYSTDIATAFKVVEKFITNGEGVDIGQSWYSDEFNGKRMVWRVEINFMSSKVREIKTGEKTLYDVVIVENETAPLTICLAALKAVGVEV